MDQSLRRGADVTQSRTRGTVRASRATVSTSPNATCKFKRKVGKNNAYYQCECNPGFTGNGIQCKDKNGEMSFPSDLQVEMTLKLESDLVNFPHTAGNFSEGKEMETLVKKMKAVNQKCKPNSQDCQATFNMQEL